MQTGRGKVKGCTSVAASGAQEARLKTAGLQHPTTRQNTPQGLPLDWIRGISVHELFRFIREDTS